MIFDIEVKEELSRVEHIEADTLDEAISEVMDRYHNEDIVLDAEDFKKVTFNQMPQEKEKMR